MPRVEITFLQTGNRSREGGTMPVAHRAGLLTEAVAADATSRATVSAASGEDSAFVRIWSEADVWAVAGAAPEASAPAPGETVPGWRVPARMPVYVALEDGDRVAVVALS